MTGRTLVGSPPPRNQHLGGHYFGAIPPRAFAFMSELETACHKLGIPLTTRHNEAAPSQYECAPEHEPLNVAIDHQLLLMDLIDRLADQHHFAALLHEKPFFGVNGSGKHNNWSLQTGQGRNLLSPGPTPEANLMFLAFFVCVIRAVAEHADLLLASVASLGNDLRLNGPEAPPSIISVFVGSMLNKVLDDIENPPRRKRNEQISDLMHLGISEIPELLVDNTDRNRTSPFAFTGNKFEFRAVGASANSSGAMAMLNAMVAQKLKRFKKRVESKINRGRNKEAAVLDMLREYISESKHIRFEGDSSSPEWQAEAKKRKLSQISHAPQAYEAFLDPKAYAVLIESGLYSEAELKARHEVLLQSYLGQLQSEADVLEELLNSYVFPALLGQQKSLLDLAQLTQATKGATVKSGERLSQAVNELESLQEDLLQVREQGQS
ncbi:MAG: glutamine synthetase type III, partial [Bacteroidota bacterium]